MPTDVDQTVEVSTVAHPSIEMCGPGVTTWFKQQINGVYIITSYVYMLQLP